MNGAYLGNEPETGAMLQLDKGKEYVSQGPYRQKAWHDTDLRGRRTHSCHCMS